MKSKQDINKLFQENQHRLDERPSERAWDRLESRLDAHQRPRRLRPRFPLMSIAASLLLLVAMITAISLMFRSTETLTVSTEALAPASMEVLNNFDKQKGVYTIAVSYQRYLNQSPRYSVTEGSENKQLRYRSIDPNVARGDFLASAKEKKVVAEDKVFKKRNEPQINRNNTPPSASAFKMEEVHTPSRSADKIVANNAPVEEIAADYSTNENLNLYETESAGIALSDSDVASPPSIEQEQIASSSMSRAKDKRAEASKKSDSKKGKKAKQASSYPIDPTSNSITYSADANTAGVDQFKWLIGQWKGQLDADRQAMEKWRQIDDFTIEGSGQLVINGDTTFTEGMKIQKLNDQVYFILALDENKQEVRFRLHSYQPTIAIFQAEEGALPNQLILQQHSTNNFSTTLQNNAVSDEIQPEQLRYLQNRNNVEQNLRTTRNMSRVYK